jgi:crotonobetaine/carnitine-CoA ligase
LNLGYVGLPEESMKSWRNGWFHTGDVFRVDTDGNFYFVDRLKDAIRRRGENISSFEVEAIVNRHPDVVESAAVAVPSELGEDDVKVVVVRRVGSDLNEPTLIEFLIPIMPRFMIPRYIEFVDTLPKTPTDRVQKALLRAAGITHRTWDRTV